MWVFEGSSVPEPTRYELTWKDTTSETSGTTVHLQPNTIEFTIDDIDAGVKYEISVVAIYDDGRQYVGKTALQLNVPRTPKVESVQATEMSIALSWEASAVDTGTIKRPVDGYELSWRIGEPGATLTSVTLDNDVTEYQIDGLLSGTEYELALVAHNGLGTSQAFITTVSTDSSAVTPTPTPTNSPSPVATPTPTATTLPSDPEELRFSELTTEGAAVEWAAQLVDGALPTAFELSWSPVADDSPAMPVQLSPSTRRYLISGVEAKTQYEIKISAVYDDGSRITEHTAFILDVPRKPDAHVDVVTTNNIRLTWVASDDQANIVKRPAQSYELSWRRNSPDSQSATIYLDAPTASFTIEGLSGSTEYEIVLQASNALGYGEAWVWVVKTETVPPILENTLTPAATPPPVPTPMAEISGDSRTSSTKASTSNRDNDPEPPEDFSATQGRHGIIVHWDNPQWDGGSKILAYAVDWRPEPPPFPILLPPDERSAEILGMKSGINYRMRVKALNQRDDSLPAAKRIYVRDTLIRARPHNPFTGSISNGRSTVLKNETELHGFEIHAAPESLFWGDELAVSIQRHPPEEELIAEMTFRQFANVSDIFTVVATPHSRRSRFDSDATSYQFGKPVVLCITPNLLDAVPIHSYSIVQIVAPSDIRIFDSAPVKEDDEIKICARIRELDVNKNSPFAVISNQLAAQADGGSPIREERPIGNVAIVLVMFAVGPTFIVGGLTVLRQAHKPPPEAV